MEQIKLLKSEIEKEIQDIDNKSIYSIYQNKKNALFEQIYFFFQNNSHFFFFFNF